MTTTTVIKQRPFLDQFADAVRFAGAGLVSSAPIDLRVAFTKASVLHSVLAIESISNSLLTHLDWSSRLLDNVDRWQPIEKMEFALAFLTDKKLDRGCIEVQAITELFSLRNAYVHAKSREVTTIFHHTEKILEIPAEVWPALKIAKEPHRWNFEAAKKVLVAVDDFISYYLLDLVGFSTAQAMEMLLPGMVVDGDLKLTFVVEHKEVLRKAKEAWKLPLRWIDLEKPFEDIIDTRDSTVTKLHTK